MVNRADGNCNVASTHAPNLVILELANPVRSSRRESATVEKERGHLRVERETRMNAQTLMADGSDGSPARIFANGVLLHIPSTALTDS